MSEPLSHELAGFLWFMFRDLVWVFVFWLAVWLTGYFALGGR